MPNWTHASITFTAPGDPEALLAVLQHLRDTGRNPDGHHLSTEHGSEEWNLADCSLVQAFYPMPGKYRDTVSGSPSIHSPADDGPTWLEWARANWGTKWPDSDTHVAEVSDDRFVVECKFPWGLAFGLLQMIVERHSAIVLVVEWDDEFDGSWRETRFSAGAERATRFRPDLELNRKQAQKVEYIGAGYVQPHECVVGACDDEECPMTYASDSLTEALAAGTVGVPA